MPPIIDTHQHLWDLNVLNLPWLAPGGPISTSHVMADYLHAAQGLDIVATVYMEVDAASDQKQLEAENVLAQCADPASILSGAIIGGDPGSAMFQSYIKRFTNNRSLKGVRQVLHGDLPRGYCLNKDFIKNVRMLGEMGLCFDLCMRPDELADGAQLARECPETRFVLDHCGNGPVYVSNSDTHRDLEKRDIWKHGVDEMATQSNVVCKISGIIAQVDPDNWSSEDLAPIIDHCVAAFGHDRIMFASDWPVCTLGASLYEWVIALRSIVAGWNEVDQHKLFYANAAHFYELPNVST